MSITEEGQGPAPVIVAAPTWAVAVRLAWGRPARLVLAGVYVAALVWQVLDGGIPFDRWRLVAWILVALAISCVGRPWRRTAGFARDWVVFLVLLVAYMYSGGIADELGMPVHGRSIVRIEETLFFGHVPSVWLQRHLLPDGRRTPVGVWEIGVTVVYVSHFILPYVVAGYLWVRDRRAWLVYVTRFAIVCFAAVVTFALLPTAPPWMAADRGWIGEVIRPVGRGWERISLHAATTWIDVGRNWANPVAAIPSLHTALATLVTVTFWPRVRSPFGRAVLVAFPLAMGFVLVYGAEHYVLDVALGALYVAGAVVVQRALWRWWERRRQIDQGSAVPSR